MLVPLRQGQVWLCRRQDRRIQVTGEPVTSTEGWLEVTFRDRSTGSAGFGATKLHWRPSYNNAYWAFLPSNPSQDDLITLLWEPPC
jgi:hypothetical protein